MNPVLMIALSDDTKLSFVIADLIANRGYFQNWTVNGTETSLPPNCVWKVGGTLDAAISDAKLSLIAVNSQQSLSLTLLSCVALNSTPWSSI